MDRTKKIWSIVLLCAEILLAVALVVLVIFADELVLGGMDASETKAEALGVLLAIAALIYILPLVGMFFGSIGFVLSLVNIKIAHSKVIKGISIGFCVLYSLLLLSGAVLGLYYWMQFNII